MYVNTNNYVCNARKIDKHNIAQSKPVEHSSDVTEREAHSFANIVHELLLVVKTQCTL